MLGGQDNGSARVPALDGLRGVAVAGVLLFHAEVGGFGGGFLGVSIFFTLSGFLITSLLLVEHESTGRISLGRFWARRARRILPAALIALAGVAVFGLTIADAQQAARLPGDGLAALAEVANWRFVLGDQSYASLFSEPSPVQHFWSLAIEEQFYLLFPLVVVATLGLAGGKRRSLAAVVIALAAASAVAAAVLFAPGHDPARVYYGTDTRAVELLVGALLAIALAGRHRLDGRTTRIAVAAGGMVAFVVLIVAWVLVDQSDGILYRGGLAIHAVLVAGVITAALVPGPVRAALAIAPLRALGLISYGVYLYHWPIFLWLTPERTGLDGMVLFGERMALTVAVAVVSYRWIEQPIRHGTRISGWRPAVAGALAAATVAALFVSTPGVSTAPKIVFSSVNRPAAVRDAAETIEPEPAPAPAPATAPAADPQTLPVTGPAPPGTVPPAPPPPPVRRIVLVGDSVAQTLGRGLERWGAANGISVMNLARFYCGIPRGGRLAMTLGGRSEACEDWAERWPPMLADFRPDVVVVLSTIWDVGGRQRDEWGPDFVDIGDPRFDRFVEDEWRNAVDVLGSTGARVVWLTNPCARTEGLNDRLQHANTKYLVGLMRTRPVASLDLATHVCPDGTFTDRLGPVEHGRPDGMHFSDPGADWVASWLGPLLTDPTFGRAGPTATSTARVRRA